MKLFGVQFGAGNIGRGFIGHLLQESGLWTVFVEANEDLVAKLRERGCYPLRLIEKDGTFRDVVIDRIEVLSVKEEAAVAEKIAFAALVLTAVGAKNLPQVAPLLARGIEERRMRNPEPLNVFLCENLKDAPAIFREKVQQYLSPEGMEFLKERVGFVGTVIARMVPVLDERFGVTDPLGVVAESYARLPLMPGRFGGFFHRFLALRGRNTLRPKRNESSFSTTWAMPFWRTSGTSEGTPMSTRPLKISSSAYFPVPGMRLPGRFSGSTPSGTGMNTENTFGTSGRALPTPP